MIWEGKDVFCELLRVLVKRQNHDEDIINPRTSAEVELNLLKSCSIFVFREFWNPLQYSAACSVLKSFPVRLGRRSILRWAKPDWKYDLNCTGVWWPAKPTVQVPLLFCLLPNKEGQDISSEHVCQKQEKPVDIRSYLCVYLFGKTFISGTFFVENKTIKNSCIVCSLSLCMSLTSTFPFFAAH